MDHALNLEDWRHAISQKQFLNVVTRDEAVLRFQSHLHPRPQSAEVVPLSDTLGRVLACDVAAPIDVPGFDRSNVDGFALRAADTSGASEEEPLELTINQEVLAPGLAPQIEVQSGTATPIATGGMVPRGADAIVMIEHTEAVDANDGGETPRLRVFRSAAPGQSITFAGTDIARGETILRRGQCLTSREVGVLAALGLSQASVLRKPRVAVISTGNEIVAPGDKLPIGCVYDSNAAILSAAIEELGCEPVVLGTVRDDVSRLREIMRAALDCDAVVLSGGTSKGAGDLSYQAVSELSDPGIVAHGVALKPGKPICLAVTDGKPVVVLPGFPTSAVFTFHEFVAPVLRQMAGLPTDQRATVEARLPQRVNSERGRTEYLLVSLVHSGAERQGQTLPAVSDGLTAWPIGRGSGSVTTFSLADGFVTIDQHTEMIDAGDTVSVTLLSDSVEPADLVVIGSHCVGLDLLIGELRSRGFSAKVLSVGSMGGVNAVRRGECDVAGVHLMDPQTGEYNRHFVSESVSLVEGYRRKQGIVFRAGDARFEGLSVEAAVANALSDPDCSMINRNPGSGTRVLIDQLLDGNRPPGFNVQTKSHNAVATAVVQQRADWGVAIQSVATQYGLGFLPLQDEHYDFLIPTHRRSSRAVSAFIELLADREVLQRLAATGMFVHDNQPA
jgi:putative molybdopterin biosynthesis protein